jgi:hypothetical protein
MKQVVAEHAGRVPQSHQWFSAVEGVCKCPSDNTTASLDLHLGAQPASEPVLVIDKLVLTKYKKDVFRSTAHNVDLSCVMLSCDAISTTQQLLLLLKRV